MQDQAVFTHQDTRVGSIRIAATKPQSSRVSSMQLLRAFAALAIVASHSSTPEYNLSLGPIRIDLFFVLSGFMMIVANRRIYESATPVITFIRRRIIRIVPLYWVFTTLALIARRNLHPPVAYVFSSYLFLPFRGNAPRAFHYYPILIVGWTLSYEMLFYVCIAVCIWLRKSPLWLTLPFSMLALYGIYDPQPSHAILSLFNYHLLEFAAGMLFAHLYVRGILLPRIVAAITLIGSVFFLFGRQYQYKETNIPELMPFAILIVLSLLSFEAQIRAHAPRFIEKIADISYPLYLIHQQFVIIPMNRILKARHLNPTTLTGFLFELLLIYAISITAAILVHRWIEVPILARFGVRIGGHKASRSAATA